MKKIMLLLLLPIISALSISPSLWANKVIPLPELLKPETMEIDRGQLYVTEFPYIYIYSLKDYKLVKKFGKAGEGPKEFVYYVRVQPHQDNKDRIVVNSSQKLSFYTRNGEYINEIRAKATAFANNFKSMGDNIYAAYGYRHDRDKISYMTVNYFDAKLDKIKEVTKWRAVAQRNGSSYNPLHPDSSGGEFRTYDKKLYVLQRDEGKITIFDTKGKEISSFGYDYEKIPLDQQKKEKILNFYKTSSRYREVYIHAFSQFEFPKHYPAARGLNVSDDIIYILTYKQEAGKSEFILFDQKGRFLKKVMVPFQCENPLDTYPYQIHKGKLYQLVDDESAEEWQLHIHDLSR